MLQQYLPFTVLKLAISNVHSRNEWGLQQYLPFTVLKHSISFINSNKTTWLQQYLPFTVLKPYFCSFFILRWSCCNSTYRLRYWNRILLLKRYYLRMLQQYLPFTVLKQESILIGPHLAPLQQYLPFTVLKLCKRYWIRLKN